MYLSQINLTNFRNYSKLNLKFDNRPTILLGDNAVGKSNLLESIYFLSTTKSPRVETEVELIKEGEEVARVEGIVIASEAKQSMSEQDSIKIATSPTAPRNDETVLEIAMQNSEGSLPAGRQEFSKRIKVNGIPRRAIDFIGNLPAVIFYPTDINMVTGSPSLRRWHLDLGLAQVDPEYKKVLTQYEQIVVSRNRILKRIREGEGGLDELTYWSEELVSKGKVVSEKRQAFFEFVNNLDNSLGNFKFELKQKELSQEKLDQYSSREIAAATTLIGPHRDDFVIMAFSVIPAKAGIQAKEKTGSPIRSGMTTGGRNLAHFGSRGEQRTATLAFKLAQLEFMAKVLGTRPLLLLDDVFSELDAGHRAAVISIVEKQQTIIATVELEHIPKKFLNSARILRVEDGKIIEA